MQIFAEISSTKTQAIKMCGNVDYEIYWFDLQASSVTTPNLRVSNKVRAVFLQQKQGAEARYLS